MKRLKLGYKFGFFLLIATGIIGCKNKDSDRNTSINELLAEKSTPAYETLDWSKEFKFNKLTLAEKKEKFRQINDFYTKEWERSNASGGLIVAWKGQIIFEGYSGFSDIGKKIEITAETPIHLASVSKVLTAIAVLKLVQFKKINLNDKINKYLSDFPYEDVTIQQLLSHRSGLPDYLHFSEDKAYWDKSEMMTNQNVLDILVHKKPPIAFKAGSKFTYNNTNYVLLALIIEKVCGASYPEVMKYMVFDPLGMSNTFVMEFDKDADKVSKSYYSNGNPWNYDHLDKTYGDKNIYSTPRDLLKMDIAMYSPKFLPKELKELAWKGYSYEKFGNKNYGLGIRMYEWGNGDKLLYHKGLWHGNRSTYVRDFQDEVCVIALGNRKNYSIYESTGLVNLFYNYPIPNVPETVKKYQPVNLVKNRKNNPNQSIVSTDESDSENSNTFVEGGE